MPENTAVPSARRISAPGPVAITSGTTPRMKAKAVIRIGRRRRRQASTTASTGVRPCCSACLRELDDQDRVLGRKADEHHEADLGQDVVVLPAQADADERRQHAHRNDQHDGERQGPALVLRREHEEHEQHRKAEDVGGRAAGRSLLIGEFRPFDSRRPAAGSAPGAPWRRAPGRTRPPAACRPARAPTGRCCSAGRGPVRRRRGC